MVVWVFDFKLYFDYNFDYVRFNEVSVLFGVIMVL